MIPWNPASSTGRKQTKPSRLSSRIDSFVIHYLKHSHDFRQNIRKEEIYEARRQIYNIDYYQMTNKPIVSLT